MSLHVIIGVVIVCVASVIMQWLEVQESLRIFTYIGSSFSGIYTVCTDMYNIYS